MASGLITRSSVISDFNSSVPNRISYKYHSGNLPVPGDNYEGATPNIFSSGLSYMGAGNVSAGLISARTLMNDITNFIYYNYSNIRNIHIIWRNTGNDSNINREETTRACLNSGYRTNIPTVNLGISSGQNIRTPNWGSAYNTWSSATSGIAYTITYTTHVAHGSHGSRVRR